MRAVGERTRGEGKIYLTGGGTALLVGWRATTIDIDLKALPEPAGLFALIAQLKEELNINVELAAPDDFIPELPGWQERSRFIARYGAVDFYHYDPYAQALAKLERGYDRDLSDVRALVACGMVAPGRLWELFLAIEPALIRFPAIEPAAFRGEVAAFCRAEGDAAE